MQWPPRVISSGEGVKRRCRPQWTDSEPDQSESVSSPAHAARKCLIAVAFHRTENACKCGGNGNATLMHAGKCCRATESLGATIHKTLPRLFEIWDILATFGILFPIIIGASLCMLKRTGTFNFCSF